MVDGAYVCETDTVATGCHYVIVMGHVDENTLVAETVVCVVIQPSCAPLTIPLLCTSCYISDTVDCNDGVVMMEF